MEESDLLKLQNGSDVRGIAMEGVAGEKVNLLPEAVNVIAAAFVVFLAKKYNKISGNMKIAVGHDSRLSAEVLKDEAIKGIMGEGATAVDCGMASTPAMFMSIVFDSVRMDGAIMITASHLPFNRNGLKFFTRDGGLEKADITEVLKLAATLDAAEVEMVNYDSLKLIDIYSDHLCDKIRSGVKADDNYQQPLQGMHIVVDAGNGAGGFFVDKVLKPLGADTTGSCFLDPDGRFPNHIPNPENKDAMASIKQAVLEHKADLGIIFDTDVDRMSAVLPDGKEINRNALIAMMAAILSGEYPNGTIVTDSVTSDELTIFLEQHLKLKHHRYMRGYKNVINECIRLNNSGEVSPLAIETSGHGALSENYYLDDGAYLAVKLIIAAAKAMKTGDSLAELIRDLGYPAEAREYRLYIRGVEDFKAYGAQVLDKFRQRAVDKGIKLAEPSFEGIRLVFPDKGWVLLRLSLHDPNMPMNIEGRNPGDCERLTEIAKELVAGFEHLDISVMD
ncbi:MAG: phosphomannomutase/phosphoglucomutase [Anaerovibrio sp.]|uniref:phosphomannomutase/phosphoglucomutase n=1 Tax=Anaerovibrio sp. TaxID=1872532 RepID=UPI0025DBC3A8|nr:phosphomannomutase/phosphoglucomutase [Anaerovibrio sp.]MCR5177108.1 phosphomannomutase/phosphoglucomutase [Anaerovibrio sp.]